MAISSTVLPDAELEAEAQILAQRIRELTEEEFLQIARLLVGKPNRELFGETEVRVHDFQDPALVKAIPYGV